MKIAIISAEVWPFSKTGGLADYANSLSTALGGEGHEVDVITPNYSSTSSEGEASIDVNGKDMLFERQKLEDWSVVKVTNADFFGRKDLYGYEDDYRRFAYFSRAVATYIMSKNYDVVHCNDWQTAFTPLLLKTMNSKIPTVYTIHNLEFQGNAPRTILDEIGIPQSYFHMDGVEFYGNASPMKSGIVYSDRLVTVSPTYSREIQTQEYGFGMEGIIRKHSGKLVGILNGIDYNSWNPAEDPGIAANFSNRSMEGKSKCKSTLQREFALPQVRRPLLAFIGRLWRQKGMDLLIDALKSVKGSFQFIALGTGDKDLMKRLEDLSSVNPAYRAILRYDEKLAHRIYAGADMFIMPSRFEPCGLGQMISMRYGTVPVVRKTGGLADTVRDYDMTSGEGNGFVFSGNDPLELASAISSAIGTYSDKSRWKKLVTTCMKRDFSWQASAHDYIDLYNSISSGIRAS